VTALVDTGPLVSAFARREKQFKKWAEKVLASCPIPLVTCEAVLTEACHLLVSPDPLLEAVERGLIVCPFDLEKGAKEVRWLMRKYCDQPMDLADACLVHLYGTYRVGTAKVVTVDRKDFAVYRTRAGQRVDCWFPEDDTG
jgi:predicted nucleic acid-binding protein